MDRRGKHNKPGKSGFFGVAYCNKRKHWYATINTKQAMLRGKENKQIKYLGSFDEPEDAAEAYDIAAHALGKVLLNFGPGGLYEDKADARQKRGDQEFGFRNPTYKVSNRDVAKRIRDRDCEADQDASPALPFPRGTKWQG